MRGFIYRLGVRIKNAGENANLVFLIKLGLGIRDIVSRVGVIRTDFPDIRDFFRRAEK